MSTLSLTFPTPINISCKIGDDAYYAPVSEFNVGAGETFLSKLHSPSRPAGSRDLDEEAFFIMHHDVALSGEHTRGRTGVRADHNGRS